MRLECFCGGRSRAYDTIGTGIVISLARNGSSAEELWRMNAAAAKREPATWFEALARDVHTSSVVWRPLLELEFATTARAVVITAGFSRESIFIEPRVLFDGVAYFIEHGALCIVRPVARTGEVQKVRLEWRSTNGESIRCLASRLRSARDDDTGHAFLMVREQR